ncbi:hypothetical protein [Parvularcula maris]|uniref:ABC transporter substrate-binding protein n=1 Tax=Parvularcula maris TaxID=2965077 RepID=A0A9X2RKU6_9PROT|nr:hypothetical protein [Parvularcula maris]MCQ8185972.1 hypothetical protein [Parvularcula maris]
MRWMLAALLFFGAAAATPDERIVSIDHCADLHILAFAERSSVAALSEGAEGDFAFLRDRAKGLHKVPPEAEAILAHRPTLVVRSYGGDARLVSLLRRSGVEIIEIGFPATPKEIAANTERLASRLGGKAPGPLAETPRSGVDRTALYLTPSGVVAGRGTLTSLLLEQAGLTNYEQRSGWHELPLEELVGQKPDLIVTGFFDSRDRFEGWWDTMRHPLARGLLEDTPRTDIPGDRMACAAFPMLAVPRLIEEGL